MQVPEKLSLIGGSILLSSTLIFTLKSQASSIVPNVGHSISHVFDHIGDTQRNVDFNNSFKDAQKNGETTGTWGSAKYYVSKDNSLHIGKGNLQGSLISVIGQEKMNNLKSINIDGIVHAPSDSTYLFAGIDSSFGDGNHSITNINGLNRMDTSKVTSMALMFNKDEGLSNVDLSHWDVSNVNNMQGMFDDDGQITNINLSGWSTSQVTNMSWMFNGVDHLQHLNINTFDTKQANVENFLGYMPDKAPMSALKEVDLGPNTVMNHAYGFPAGAWQNGNQTVDTNSLTVVSHPGIWIHQ